MTPTDPQHDDADATRLRPDAADATRPRPDDAGATRPRPDDAGATPRSGADVARQRPSGDHGAGEAQPRGEAASGPHEVGDARAIIPPPRRRAPPPIGRPRPGVDRRRPRWRRFRVAYPGFLASLWLALAILTALDVYLVSLKNTYASESHRLRSGMTALERRTADLALAANENKLRVMVALVRHQALGDRDLHLSVEVDSGVMVLEREGALLREMPVRVAPEEHVGTSSDTIHLVAPRGSRTVEKILSPDSVWDVPRWVYADRHLPVDSSLHVRGALGDAAIVLDGGTVIYGDPTTGPLADSAYVLPGSVRARAADLKAIVPNLRPGMNVYFY